MKKQMVKVTNTHIGMGVVLRCVQRFRTIDPFPARDTCPFILVSVEKPHHAEVCIRGTEGTFLIKKSDIVAVIA
jgi:hypothetical protein